MMSGKCPIPGILFGFIILLIPLLFSACDVLQQPQTSVIEGTITPTPTQDPSGYQAVPPRSCLVGDWSTIQAERRQAGVVTWMQGGLLAFQPNSGNGTGPEHIAYLAPTDRTSWLAGELRIAEGPEFEQHLSLARSVLAVGDLTWAPSGSRLAFLAFRTDDSLYTIMTVEPDGSGLIDLFPADLARTDDRSSQKAIVDWKNDQTLTVIASCGEECRQAYDIDINQTTGAVLMPTPIPDYKEMNEKLKIQRFELDFEPDDFPKGLRDPHWSPDEKQIAYLDKRGLLWYLSIPEKISYLLDIGLRDVYETQWSSNSNYLGIRAEDRIFVFQIPCKDSEVK